MGARGAVYRFGWGVRVVLVAALVASVVVFEAAGNDAVGQVVGSLSGTVWADHDIDGVRASGEGGLAEVQVHLTFAGADGQFDTADDVRPDPQTTDGSGQYSFGDLLAGSYRVEVGMLSLPVGSRLSTPSPVEFDVSVGGSVSVDFGVVLPRALDPVSRLSGGARGDSWAASVTPDGRYVALWTENQLVDDDTNGLGDVYVLDRQTRTYELVSRRADGTVTPGGGYVDFPVALSDDGRYVAFQWSGDELVSGSAGGCYEVYYRDLVSDETVRVDNVDAWGNCWNVEWPGLSADGRVLTFVTAFAKVSGDTNGRSDVYAWDVDTGEFELVSISTAGVLGDADSYRSSVSGDGRFVAFRSDATSLVAGDTNGVSDVFVRDRQAATLTRVSVGHDGSEADGASEAPSISADGGRVAFHSKASNLVAGGSSANVYVTDVATLDTVAASGSADATTSLTLSPDGGFVGYTLPVPDTPTTGYTKTYDAYVVELASQRVEQVAAGLSKEHDSEGRETEMSDLSIGARYAVVVSEEWTRWNGSCCAGWEHVVWVEDRALTCGPACSASFGWDGYGAWFGGVNAASGNFVTDAADAQVASPRPPLEVARTYNSRSFGVGGFGFGWTSLLDMRAVADATGDVTVVHPDGRHERHTARSDGTFAPPAGYFSQLTDDGGTYTLTSKDRTVYTFRADGRLDAVVDANGRTLDLVYDTSGVLQTIGDGSRTLTVTWESGRVSQVATDSVAAHGGSLVWRYYYSGDLLTRVCDPRDNSATGSCTVYEYDATPRLRRVVRPQGNTEVSVGYQPDGRVAWRADGIGATTTYRYPDDRTVEVTDPRGNTTTATYDDMFRVTGETDAAGHTTTYAYDAAGNRSQIVDPNDTAVTMGYDTRGNLTSRTCVACAADGSDETVHHDYDTADNLVATRDARSAGPADDTYKTSFTYDTAGNRLTETSPPISAFPSGTTRTWTYTDGTETGYGGVGTVPAGLVATETDARGNTTTYTYDDQGDLRETVDRAGLKTVFDHDELGRVVSETVYSDSFPAGVTTTYGYDQVGNLTAETGPAATNPISGVDHQAKTVHVYDRNDRRTSTTVEDLTGGDTPRTTNFAYDDADRLTTTTDPEGGSTVREYDQAGNVIRVTDPEGRRLRTDYDARSLPEQVVLENFDPDPADPATAPRAVTLTSYGYDDAGRKTTETDAEGRTRTFAYDGADRITSISLDNYTDPDSTVRPVTLEARRYDRAGNLVREEHGDGTRVITHTYDPAGRRTTSVLDPGGLARTTSYDYDANGNPTVETVTQDGRTETVTRSYDAANRPTAETVDNGPDDLTSWFGYDQRGLRTAVTDPRGTAAGDPDHTTDISYDELGRPTQTQQPPVTVTEHATTPTTARPTTTTGYDTYGNPTHRRDERGQTTVTAYDRLDRATTITHPAYSPPDGSPAITPTETFVYDKVGNLTSRTSRRGHTTDYVFDSRNRVVRQIDPQVTGQPTRGTTVYGYDHAGNRTVEVDPTGVRTEHTYDTLDQPRSRTVFDDDGQPLTTRFEHDLLGNLTRQTDPTGATTSHVYDAAGQRTATTDAAGQTWTADYDLAGRTTRETDPLGRTTTRDYDLAGRHTTTRRYAAGADPTVDAPLTVETFDHDAAGNRTGHATPRGVDGGWQTNFQFDAADRLVQVTTPVDASTSITVNHGHDAAGNHTRTTDGRTNAWWTTYQPWGLPEDTIEPATGTHPDTTDRTFTVGYDAGGLPVAETHPGGITITRTHDELGRPTTETGSDGTTRTFGYDLAGRTTAIGHPAGTQTYSYNPRGLLAAATGPAGNTTHRYDDAGRLNRRDDPAGTHTFTWTDRGELASAADPLTGQPRHYRWDPAGQLDQIRHGPDLLPLSVRDLEHDDLGRPVTDTHRDTLGTTSHQLDYDYDPDGNVTGQTITAPGNPAAGTHTYTYDRTGRITAWTDPASATTVYSWDPNGNRTAAGTDTYTYDERNRLTAGPSGTSYTHTARGTLDTVTNTSGTTTYTFDHLGRQTAATGPSGTVDYTYDTLDRIATRNGDPFTYTGTDLDPTGDPTATYARSPSGRILAVDPTGDDPAVHAGLNRHGDLAYLHNTDGTTTASRIYDPFGQPAGTTGTGLPAAGYQADYTDPTTNEVWMGARWYQPNTATFTTRDTYPGELTTPISLNRYTYAHNNPLAYFDPDGHAICETDRCGGPGEHTVQDDAGRNIVQRTPQRRARDQRKTALAAGRDQGWSDTKTAAVAGFETINIIEARGNLRQPLPYGAKLSDGRVKGPFGPYQPDPWRDRIAATDYWADYFGIDPAALAITLEHESGWTRAGLDILEVLGFRDSKGVGSIRVPTAKDRIGDHFGVDYNNPEEIAIRLQNIDFNVGLTAAHLHYLEAEHGLPGKEAFVAYAFGDNAIQQHLIPFGFDADELPEEDRYRKGLVVPPVCGLFGKLCQETGLARNIRSRSARWDELYPVFARQHESSR